MITIVAAFIFSVNAYSNPYLSINIGATFSSRDSSFTDDSNALLFGSATPVVGMSLFSLPDVTWNNDYSSGFEGSFAVGYETFSNWALEGEFLYQNFERHIDGMYNWQEVNPQTNTVEFFQDNNPINNSSARVRTYSLLTNGIYNFNNCTQWIPYIGAGLGVTWLQSNGTSDHDTLNVFSVPGDVAPILAHSPSLYGTAFAWQFKAGIAYLTESNLSIALQYRLFGTTKFKATQSNIITHPNTPDLAVFSIAENDVRGLLQNGIDINIEYFFDSF